MQSFEVARETDRPPDAVLPWLVTDLSRDLASANYKLQNVLESGSDRILTFTRTYRAWPIWVFGVILLPLLFLNNTATITVVLEPTEGSGTRVRVAGKAEGGTVRAFEAMEL
jgi:hypothetical protein